MFRSHIRIYAIISTTQLFNNITKCVQGMAVDKVQVTNQNQLPQKWTVHVEDCFLGLSSCLLSLAVKNLNSFYECIAPLAFSASLCNRFSSVIRWIWQSILGKCAVLIAYAYQNITNHCNCML